MSTFRSHRPPVLAAAYLMLSAVLLASVSNAGANDITYKIVDYPANEADAFSGTDTISGTIITDGTIGLLSVANIISGDLSFTDPEGDLFTGPASFGDTVGLQATPTQLVLDPGIDSIFSISNFSINTGAAAQVVYENNPGNGQYYGGLTVDSGSMVALIGSFDSAPVPTGPGSIGASSSWVIASVPEPASLALLFPAMLVLAVVYFRRCWIHRVYRSREAFVADLETVFRRLPENHRVLVGAASRGSTVRTCKTLDSHTRPHFDGLLRNTGSRKRTAGWTHRPRTLACEPLETRTLLSASLPAGWQAVPIGSYDLIAPAGYTGSSVPYGLTPNQVRGAYGLGSYTSGILSNGISLGTIQGDGTGQTIAIVDAYDDPNAIGDLNAFSTYFGLPTLGGPDGATFEKLTYYGQPVSSDPASPNYVSTDPSGPYWETGQLTGRWRNRWTSSGPT